MVAVTEEEAKQKWCPLVRHSTADNPVACNRIGLSEHYNENPYFSRCIGSQCMFWKWASDHSYIVPEAKRKGYCALAE